MNARAGLDWGFVGWFVIGFLVAFGYIAGFTIGLPFLALGLILFAWFWWRGPGWPADLGLLAGPGAVCLLIAALRLLDGGGSPTVWGAVGIALTATGVGTFAWLRCRSERGEARLGLALRASSSSAGNEPLSAPRE